MTSSKKADIAAILAAGGKGLRFGDGKSDAKSKQFVEMHGRPLYLWSLLALCNEPRISRVIIMMPHPMVDIVKKEIAEFMSANKIDKEISVVPGGKTRQESVYFGLMELSSCVPEFVLIHDACRPFLSHAILCSVIDEVLKSGACTIAVPVFDTVKRINERTIVETLDRQALNLVQTPQAFNFDLLLEAHKSARDKGLEVTDDAAILEAQGNKVTVVEGSPYNLKVTNKEDLAVCEALSSIFLRPSF